MAGAQSPVAWGVVGASLFATGPRATVPLGRRGVSPSCPLSEARVHLNTVTWPYSRLTGHVPARRSAWFIALSISACFFISSPFGFNPKSRRRDPHRQALPPASWHQSALSQTLLPTAESPGDIRERSVGAGSSPWSQASGLFS